MIKGLTSCTIIKATPSSGTLFTITNPTGVVPKLVHILCDHNASPYSTNGSAIEMWLDQEMGVMYTTHGTNGNNITYYYSPSVDTSTGTQVYNMTSSAINIRCGATATGVWNTSTEYIIEIYTCNYELFSYTLGGKIINSDIIVPSTNVSLLVEVGAPPNGSPSNAIYIDTSLSNNTNRYLQLGFYSNYAYLDCGGQRNNYSIQSGYDGSKANRFAMSVFSDGTYIKYLSDYKATGTISSYDSLTNIGTLRGDSNQGTGGNEITAYLYKSALTDEQLYAYITNNIIP